MRKKVSTKESEGFLRGVEWSALIVSPEEIKQRIKGVELAEAPASFGVGTRRLKNFLKKLAAK